ncbi:MAG: response regulator transcription factor [Bacillota bacterium]
MRLLVIEDEEALVKGIQKGFEKLGYAVDIALDGEEAVDKFFSAYYDAIILDLNLPRLDGLEVLKTIREEDKNVSVLILSARSEVSDKVEGLDLGANDYLGKPFSFQELSARVRALIRRDYSTKDRVIEIGDVMLDIGLRHVKVHGQNIALTNKEYGILEYLMVNRGEIQSAETLIEHVWNEDADAFSSAFKVHLSALRKKLPEGFIKTVRGAGYYVE